MFNSAWQPTIILSVIALGLTLPAPVEAGGVKVDKEVNLNAGGNTIAGPGIIEDLQANTFQPIFVSTGSFGPVTATIHCRRGTGRVGLFAGGNLQTFSPFSTDDLTTSARAALVDQINVGCAAASPQDCECLWRVDKEIPNPSNP